MTILWIYIFIDKSVKECDTTRFFCCFSQWRHIVTGFRIERLLSNDVVENSNYFIHYENKVMDAQKLDQRWRNGGSWGDEILSFLCKLWSSAISYFFVCSMQAVNPPSHFLSQRGSSNKPYFYLYLFATFHRNVEFWAKRIALK